MNYTRITIGNITKEISDRLIAQLAEINFDSFEEEGEGEECILSAYAKEGAFGEAALKQLLGTIKYTRTLIPETNWNAEWEKDFAPVYVEDFAAVRADFHHPATGVKYELIITPRMSFGTGHHDTTWLMIQQMRQLDFKNKNVLDFGTGTGVLAILAEKMGAARVTAIDHDEWSIENAKDNIAVNQCDHIHLRKGSSVDGTGLFDILLANINLNILTKSAEGIKDVCREGASILLSGFLTKDVELLKIKFSEAGFNHLSTACRNGWAVVLLKKS